MSATAMTRPSPARLDQLPVEIVWKVLHELPSLRDMLSAALVCRHVHQSYLQAQRSVVLAVLRRHAHVAWGYRVGHLYRELAFAISHDNFIYRHVAHAALEEVWGRFQRLHLEGLVIRLGIALAQSYRSGGSGIAATELLQRMWRGDMPFTSSRFPDAFLEGAAMAASLPRWQPALISVGQMLLDFLGEDGFGRAEETTVQDELGRLKRCEMWLEQFAHTAELHDDKIILFPGRNRSTTRNEVLGLVHRALAPGIGASGPWKTPRPRGTIVWRFDPTESPYHPLVHSDDEDDDDLSV